ncbi:MAG: putative Ig domain-containing protein [Planctomycetes bacterium]|nr:putative Ig domain-containing protein [Planctomycetota bacterium]
MAKRRPILNPLWLAVVLSGIALVGCGGAAGTTAGSSGTPNSAPVLAAIGNRTTAEGSLLTFAISASDPASLPLTFVASGLPAGSAFYPVSKVFAWTPTYTQAGNYNVLFRVTNGVSLSDEETITVTVTDVNVTPVVAAITNKTVSEGSLLIFAVSGSDAGNDVLTYTAVGMPSGANLNSSNGTFTWTPDYTQSGVYTGVTFRATDPIGLYDEKAITITVNNTNRTPTLSGIGNKAISETALLTFTIAGSDPDGDAITYTATGLPSGAAFTSTSATFAWTPSYSQSGNYTNVRFRVTDTGGLYNEEAISIAVTNVNRAPTLNAIGNKSVNEAAVLSFTVSGSDPDVETLAYSAISLPSGASLNPSSGAFSWTPSYIQSGSYNVTFRTTDPGGLYATEPITITVNNVNRTPTLAAIGNKTISEASLLSFTISGSDPDTDAITYTAGNLPSGAVFTATSGAFDWTPSYDQSGVYPNVAFTVTDTGGLYTTEPITITVNNTNRTPTLNPVGNKSVNEGELLTFTISGSDPDGGAVTYTGVGLPAGSALVSATGVFSWTPTYLQAGTYSTVKFRANDTGGLYAEETISISVTDVNVAPVLASIGNKTANEGSALNFTVSATDAGGDALTYTATGLPSGAAVNPSSGAFSWTPAYDQAGVYPDINFKATDAGGLYDEEAITVTVNNTNRAPTLNYIGSQSVNENVLLAFTISGIDPDGDAITYSASNLPSGSVFTATTGEFAWTPTYLQANSYNVTFRATDTPGLSGQEVVAITVNNVNRACTLNPVGDKTTDEGVLLSFTISGTDIDTDDVLSYNAFNMPAGATINATSGVFTWTPTYLQANTYNVTFRTTDPYGLYDDEAITITVNNVPASPTVTTEPATGVDINMATLNGTVNPNELATTAYFEWGISTTYGATTTVQALGSGTTILNVAQVITGLEHNSIYYYRMVADNSVGTSYGINRTFTTATNTNWAMIVGGETHSMGIKNDGSLWAWGDNADGQLGLNDTVSRTVPTQVGTGTFWAEVACGSGFTIARKNNHTLWGAGDNSEGQLGLGAITGTLVFIQIGSDGNWTRITAGGQSHTLALNSSGELYAWGDNAKGQLGLGDYTNRTTPQIVTTTPVSSIAAGYDHSMAIMADGSLYAWGDNSGGQLGTGSLITQTEPTLITTTGWIDVAGGYKHTVAINTSGDIYAWGNNDEGELGTGDLISRTEPAFITASGWADISVGYKHTVALKTDGTLYSWGDNSEGQLGLGDLVSRTDPTLITGTGIITWTKTSAGWRFTAGIDSNNTLWAWGDNAFGQLGTGNTFDKNIPASSNDLPITATCWAKSYGTTFAESGVTIQQTSDNGYILAGYANNASSNNLFAMKLGGNSTVEWQKIYTGAPGGNYNLIRQASDGGYILAGQVKVGTNYYMDSWVAKLNSDGTLAWQKAYGASEDRRPRAIRQTSDGGYIVVGEMPISNSDAWIMKLNSNGSIAWQRSYGTNERETFESIEQTLDGGYIVSGCINFSDAWVLRLNSSGSIIWQRRYSGTLTFGRSIVPTSDGGYILGMEADGWMYDFCALKLNSDGTIAWQRYYRGLDQDMLDSIRQTSDGGYIMAGSSRSFGLGTGFGGGPDYDIWLVKTDSNGAIIWQKAYGGTNDDAMVSWGAFDQTSDGGYVATGSTLSFGLGGGWGDIWVLKISSDGSLPLLARDTNATVLISAYTMTTTSVPETSNTVTDVNTSLVPTATSMTINQQSP